MILFCHHNEACFTEMHNVILDGKVRIGISDGHDAISIDTDYEPARLGAPEHPGWWWFLFVFDLESGEVVWSKISKDKETLENNKWLQDPVLRAIRVAEFLAEKQKTKKG